MLYLIVNHTSATGKSGDVLKKVTARLSGKNVGYRLYRTEHKGHATEITQKLGRLPIEKVHIIVVGGDGTINEVLNGITDFDKVRIGIIPAGSGNDFAGGLKLSKNINTLVDRIIHNYQSDSTGSVDLGRVRFGDECSSIFGISSGVGMDAIVCKEVSGSRIKNILNKVHLGKLCYLFMTVYTLFSMKTAAITAYYNGKEKTIKDVIYFVGMNLRAEGGGVPMAPDALPDDGLLSFASAAGIPRWRTFLCLPFLVMAKQKMLKGFDIFQSDHAVIEASEPMVLHADGEYLGQYSRIEYECLPNKLKIIN